MRADGPIHQVSTVGRDVTERKRFEADLAHQATHDPLTGLPNRALLLDHLELELARAEREHRLVALLFLDLDRFKQVNDTLGHDAGDELLAQAAQRISAVVRPADTVARMGGDEFVILCGDVEDQDHATGRRPPGGGRPSRTDPFDIGGAELAITSSIGIALSAGGVHPEAILRDADAAMYRAKDLGRARLEIYDESMRRRHGRTASSSPRSWPTASRTARSWCASSRSSTSSTGRVIVRRGAGPLGPPDPGPAGAPRLHRAGRGDRADRRSGPAGAEHRVRARSPLGGAASGPTRPAST